MIQRLSKRILYSNIINNSPLCKSIFSTTTPELSPFSPQNRPKKNPQRPLKAYQKLFYSPPIMNINIEMIMTINQLRPKATYIIATKNGQHPKQISNSTHNIIECLKFIKGYKFYFKSFPSLIQNISKVLSDGIDFQNTGIYKTNTVKKLIQSISEIDSLYGEDMVELICVYLIRAIQQSYKIKTKLIIQSTPLKHKLKLLKVAVSQAQQKQSTLQQLAVYRQQIQLLQQQITKLTFHHRYMKQQDFLCALNYCLQKGYYNQFIVKQFFQIMQRDSYSIQDFQSFLKEEKQGYPDKPLSNIQNKRAHIVSRIFNNLSYRIRILNELKKLNQFDSSFMNFIRSKNDKNNQDTSESSSEDSPFIDGKKIQESQSSSSDDKVQQEMLLDSKLIEESIISKKSYLELVGKYMQFLDRKDTLCYILTDQTTSEGLRIMPTQFFSYLKQQQTHNTNSKQNGKKSQTSNTITLSKIKSKYLSIFKQIFDIESNGSLYAQSPSIQSTFQIILKLYTFEDRKQIFQFLKLYQRYMLSKSTINDLNSVAPFYVFEKYHYRSNFIASKFLAYINSKYRLGKEENSTKQEMIIQNYQICNYLSLYFKLLQTNIQTIYEKIDNIHTNIPNETLNSKLSLRPNNRRPTAQYVNQSSRAPPKSQQILTIKYQKQFNHAVEIFMAYYNKLISVIYLEKGSVSGFIGNGIELSLELHKTKFLKERNPDKNAVGSQVLTIVKPPEEDIKKILYENSQTIKEQRFKNSAILNVYEKQSNSKQTNSKITTDHNNNPNAINLKKHNPRIQTLFSKQNFITHPLDQLCCIIDITQTAIRLQTVKGIQFYEDAFVIFKNIFQNKKLVNMLTNNQMYPTILKQLIRISQYFKGAYKNETNKLFEYVLNLTDFNINTFLHSARIKIAKDIINTDKISQVQQKYQQYLQFTDIHVKYGKNLNIWNDSSFSLTPKNIISNISSDILYIALAQNIQLQKTIRDQLAKIKSIRPNQKINNMKFQLNYLQYPYLANLAISKNNQLIVILVRRNSLESSQYKKPYNNVLNDYYNECEQYFRKKGCRIMIAANESQIRSTLVDVIM